MHRRYNRWWSRFEQPDPYDGSYDIADPQSFNRIAYVQNDPVNFVDPTGLVTYDGAADPHLIAEGLVGGLLWAIQHGGVLAFNHGIRIGDALHAYWSFSFFTQNTGKQGGPCDQTVRDTFADDDAQAAASGFEPTGFPESAAWRNGQNRSRAGGPQPNQWGHLNGFSGHIYSSSPGANDTTLYVPGNFTSYTAPSGRDAVATFHYRQLGGHSNVTLAVFHVANFGIQRNNTNNAGSVRIGTSGGSGGDTVGYRHSHLELHRGRGLPPTMAGRNRTRLNFRRVFCP